MRLLKLNRRLSDEADLALREPIPQVARIADFDPENYVGPGESAEGYLDGKLLFRKIQNAFDLNYRQQAYHHLSKVNGDPTSRGEVVGGGGTTRIRPDGSVSKQRGASAEKVAEYRQKGAKADLLGYMDSTPRWPFCRQTAWTDKNPEILKGCWKLINTADRIVQEECPEQYEAQINHVADAIDFSLGLTMFSTMTVNKKLSTTYHRDENDFRAGVGVMCTWGTFTGGTLVFPAARVAIDYQPGALLIANVHETHGNLDDIVGDRITCVLYARENINRCGLAEDELEKALGMTIHARED